jgi:hypothetical protein
MTGKNKQRREFLGRKRRAVVAGWSSSGSFDCAYRDETARGFAQDDSKNKQLQRQMQRQSKCVDSSLRSE